MNIPLIGVLKLVQSIQQQNIDFIHLLASFESHGTCMVHVWKIMMDCFRAYTSFFCFVLKGLNIHKLVISLHEMFIFMLRQRKKLWCCNHCCCRTSRLYGRHGFPVSGVVWHKSDELEDGSNVWPGLHVWVRKLF